VQVLHFREQLGGTRAERLRHDSFVDDAPVERVGEGARLLEDLLQHEVPIRPLLGGFLAPLRLVHGTGDGPALRIEDLDGVARDLGDVALLEVDEPLRHGQQRGHAARDEVLAYS
jgi:hypothetical protein